MNHYNTHLDLFCIQSSHYVVLIYEKEQIKIEYDQSEGSLIFIVQPTKTYRVFTEYYFISEQEIQHEVLLRLMNEFNRNKFDSYQFRCTSTDSMFWCSEQC